MQVTDTGLCSRKEVRVRSITHKQPEMGSRQGERRRGEQQQQHNDQVRRGLDLDLLRSSSQAPAQSESPDAQPRLMSWQFTLTLTLICHIVLPANPVVLCSMAVACQWTYSIQVCAASVALSAH